MMRCTAALAGIFLLVIIFSGCSSAGFENGSPVDAGGIEEGKTADESGRVLWGVWEFTYDDASGEISVSPARGIAAHFDVVDFLIPPSCNDCVEVTVNSFLPGIHMLDIDVTLKNPMPIGGRDVRGIIFTNEAGHELINADGWSTLHDIPGGSILNPFKAYAKLETKRVFAGGASHTENFIIDTPMPPKFNAITYAVDASWPGNCREPFSIENFQQEKMFNTGGVPVQITVDVLDWEDDVVKVTLVAPEITGQGFTQLSLITGVTWRALISNSELAPAGDYEVRMIAKSANSGELSMQQYMTLTVSQWGIPENPVDITPPGLNFLPLGIAIENDFAYVAGGRHGLHIFNISDPTAPVWIGKEPISRPVYAAKVSGQFLYVACEILGIRIYEILIDGTLNFVNEVDCPGHAQDLFIKDGYAYVAVKASGLSIVDIDPVESANLVTTIPTAENVRDVVVQSGYAYLADSWDGVQVVDIEPMGAASIVHNIPTSDPAFGIGYANNHVFVCIYPTGIDIIDVNNPLTASVIKTVPTDSASDLVIEGDYLYVADGDSFTILDISVIASTSVIGVADTLDGWQEDVAIRGDYAFVANRTVGIQVFDISQPITVSLVKTVITPGDVNAVEILDDYAYVADWNGGLQVFDVTNPSDMHYVSGFSIPGLASDIKVSGGTAFVAVRQSGLTILDISNPLSPQHIKTFDPGDVRSLDVSGDIACLGDQDAGLHVVDITNLSNPVLSKSVSIPGAVIDVSILGDYAYVIDNASGFHVVDIQDPPNASVIQTFTFPGFGRAILADGSHAYICGTADGLTIVDVSTPGAASIVITVDTINFASDVVVANGYAYVADSNSIAIIDIDPPESASIYSYVNSPLYANSMALDGNILYAGQGYLPYGGITIFELW